MNLVKYDKHLATVSSLLILAKVSNLLRMFYYRRKEFEINLKWHNKSKWKSEMEYLYY